jgi:hypothetical protein
MPSFARYFVFAFTTVLPAYPILTAGLCWLDRWRLSERCAEQRAISPRAGSAQSRFLYKKQMITGVSAKSQPPRHHTHFFFMWVDRSSLWKQGETGRGNTPTKHQ